MDNYRYLYKASCLCLPSAGPKMVCATVLAMVRPSLKAKKPSEIKQCFTSNGLLTLTYSQYKYEKTTDKPQFGNTVQNIQLGPLLNC